MRLHPFAFAAALLFNSAAPAADMATVEVKGAKPDQRRLETASGIVLGHDELVRQGDRTLGDALKRVAGISIGDGAGRGSEIRMRGLGNGYTQLLLNGLAAPAGFALDSLAPELIERIEIVRTASAELGTQAIAGTINVILRKAPSRPRQELKLGAEQRAGRLSPNATGQVSGKEGGYAYTVSGVASRAAGAALREQLEQASGPQGESTLSRRTPQREHDDNDTLSLSPRLSWNLGDDSVTSQSFFSLNRRAVDFSAREFTLAGAPSEFPELATAFRARAAYWRSDLTWQRSFEQGTRLEVKLGFNHSSRHSDFDFGATPGGVQLPPTRHVVSDTRDSGATFGGKLTFALGGGHVLALGWDSAYSERMQTRVEHEFAPSGIVAGTLDERYDGAIRRVALFAQDEWDITPAWSLSAGLRWEALTTVIEDRDFVPARQRTDVLSPILQALHKLSATRQLRFGLSRTYKAPTMFELLPRRYTVDNNNNANNPDTQGNPRLRPELAWGLDAGYDHYLGADGKGGMLGASVFARCIDNVTLPQLFLEGTRWISRPSNQGGGVARGIALEAKMAATPALALRANLARNWSRVERVPGPGNRLDGQTRLTANLGFDYTHGSALTLGADFNYQSGGWSRVSAAVENLAPVARRLDVYGVWNVSARSRLRVGAANLLRQDAVAATSYASDDGVRNRTTVAPGHASLRIAFEHNR